MLTSIIVLIGLIILISAAAAGLSAAPWLPTKAKDREHLLEELHLKYGQKVVDLGCGDGSLLFAVARRFPNVNCVGYDISLFPLIIAWARRDVFRKNYYKRVRIKFGNLFKAPINDADVVFVFLLSKSYPRLIEKFRRELKDDAMVVVEAWPLPGIEPTRHLKKEGYLSLYFYSAKDIRRVH